MEKAKGDLSREPIYNIQSVVERSGIAAETIRAWERRYGFPNPYRRPNGYRLYSEDEIATLVWLKNQKESGVTISQAIQLLNAMRSHGQDPAIVVAGASPSRAEVEDAAQLKRSLFSALVSLQDQESNEILRRAFAGLPLESALLDVIAPTLEEVGQGWHDGRIPIAVEHFATQLCRAQLIYAMEASPIMTGRGRVVAACAPGEWHEIGLLMLTFLLRTNGWDVAYLGANLSFERLEEVLSDLKPQLLLFSASSRATADNLASLLSVLDGMKTPKPLIGLGGLAFRQDPTLTHRIPGTYFGPRADDAVRQIEAILDGQPPEIESAQ